MYYIRKDQKTIVVYTGVGFPSGFFTGTIIWAEDKSKLGDSRPFAYNDYNPCKLHVTLMQPTTKELT